MKQRTFLAISIFLMCIAIGVHINARETILQAIHRKSNRISEASKRGTPVTIDPEATRLSRSGQSLNNAGFMFVFGSMLFYVIAAVRKEPGWLYVFPILLLILDFGVYALY
jgi:hypothetical protein